MVDMLTEEDVAAGRPRRLWALDINSSGDEGGGVQSSGPEPVPVLGQVFIGSPPVGRRQVKVLVVNDRWLHRPQVEHLDDLKIEPFGIDLEQVDGRDHMSGQEVGETDSRSGHLYDWRSRRELFDQ